MKADIAVMSCVVATLISSAAAAAPVDVESLDPAVRAPLDDYLEGHRTGSRAAFERAFHPEAELFGVRGDGQIHRETARAYVARAGGGRAAADEARRKRWIESVDVTGPTGTAVIVLDYPTVRYTDYMSLMKTDGRWVIVNKTFTAESKTPPKP